MSESFNTIEIKLIDLTLIKHDKSAEIRNDEMEEKKNDKRQRMLDVRCCFYDCSHLLLRLTITNMELRRQ